MSSSDQKEWDSRGSNTTPSLQSSHPLSSVGDGESLSQPPQNDVRSKDLPVQKDDDDDSFDRQFYLQEDEGHYVQDSSNGDHGMGRFLFTNPKILARESLLKRQQPNNPRMARQSALQDDQEAWEENRLLSSGVAVRRERDMNTADSVTLLVHQVQPPFLDGRVAFSTVREAVPTVRDASSDFAKKAREGSETLRMIRANKDKNAMRNKFWELGGTRMGNAVGVAATAKTNEEAEVGATVGKDELTENGEIDYK
jgi:hypothetical protein